MKQDLDASRLPISTKIIFTEFINQSQLISVCDFYQPPCGETKILQGIRFSARFF